jgi:hypothetical protein
VDGVGGPRWRSGGGGVSGWVRYYLLSFSTCWADRFVLVIDGVDIKINGIGQRTVRLRFGFSCTFARLVRLSPLSSQSMPIRVDGRFGRWRQAFLSDSMG